MAKFTHEDAKDTNSWPYGDRIDGTTEADEIDTTQGGTYYHIHGGAGNDIINDGEGASYIYGEDGDDTINGGGASISDFFIGNTIYGGAGNDKITVTGGKNTLYGDDGNDAITGGSDNDTIYGGIGNDTLIGGAGDDFLSGDNGDDLITGGLGDDKVYGGEGTDTAVFGITSSDVVAYDNLNGVITIQSTEGSDTYEGIENFQFIDKIIALANMDAEFSHVQLVRGEEIYVYDQSEVSGTNGNDKFHVNTWNDVKINAKEGNDVINLNYTGQATIDGGDGLDTVKFNNSTQSQLGAFVEHNNKLTILTSQGTYSLTNIETIGFTDSSYSLSAFKSQFASYQLDASTILGSNASDTLSGTLQDDVFYSGKGYNDTVDGKDGNDTVIFSFSTTNVTSYSNNNGVISINANSYDSYNLKSIEKFQFLDVTLALADLDSAFIGVNTSDQTINGTQGDDSLTSGFGDDDIDGLGGDDTVVINIDTTSVSSYTNDNGKITLKSYKYGTDTYSNVESFQFNDVSVSLGDLDNTFDHVNTADKMFTATSLDDTFVGSLGQDTVILNFATTDLETFSLTNDYDWAINQWVNKVVFTSDKGKDTLTNVEKYQFTDATLSLNELSTTFSSIRLESQHLYGAYNVDDTLTGGLGGDYISGYGGNDVIKGNDGNDNLYGGTGNDKLYGNKGNDSLEGENGNDELHGGEGDDFLDGGDGDDTINGGDGNDTIYGDDYWSTSYSWYSTNGHGNDTIDAGKGDDTIYGGRGLNVIDGGEGADTVVIPFATTEVIIYGVINGEVQFDSSIAGYKIKNVENYQFTDKTLTNNDDLDSLFAHVSYNDQTITGTDGDDQGLAGGEGNNTIIPKLGNDTVYGRSGHDTVVFNIASSEVTSFTVQGVTVTFVSPEGTDEIINVDSFQFSDKTYTFDELSPAFASVNTVSQTLFGTNGDDELTGGLGDDIINSSDGKDSIDGGAKGKDILAFHITKDEVSAYSNDDGVITLTYSGSVDTISNIDFFQFIDVSIDYASLDATFAHVNTADQSIIGDDQNNELSGGLGDDTFTPKAGDDTVDGVSGNDTAILNIESSKVTGYSNDGVNVVITSTEGVDTFSNIDVFKFNDTTLNLADLDQAFAAVTVTSKTLVGDENDNTLTGALANDTITPGKGDDVVDGAAGVDTVVFNIASSDVNALSYSGDKIIITSTEGKDEFVNVELFKFADKEVAIDDLQKVFASVITDDQHIEGDESANTLTGALGNDIISPKGGDDIVDGAEGEDTAILNIESTAVTAYSINGDSVTISSPDGNDRFERIEIFQFTDATIKLQDLDSVLSAVLIKDQTFTGTVANDVFEGGEGNDVLVLGFATKDLKSVSKDGETYRISGTEGTDTISKIESLQFSDQTLAITELLLGSDQAETITGTSESDIIDGDKGLDSIASGAGDDLIINAEVGENIDGGLGSDLVKFNFASTEVSSIMRKLDGSVELSTSKGTSTLAGVEAISFTDTSTTDIDSYINSKNPLKPSFNAIVKGKSIAATPEEYKGGVDFLEFQLLGDADGNIVTGSAFNDFLNLLDGDDAANGGAGRDVLDGGTGSNFLTGGAGADTFFLDGRGGTTTWSTITDFDGDSVNIWGWKEGVSQLIQSVNNAGADGFKGATFHYDLNNDGLIDTSITFSGLTADQVPASSAQEVSGNGYLLFS